MRGCVALAIRKSEWLSTIKKRYRASTSAELMERTRLSVDFTGDLLAVVPPNLPRIVDVGCSGGGLAREYLKNNEGCEYIGIEIDPNYAKVAAAHCTRVLVGDIECMSDEVFDSIAGRSSWIFGDVLEHLYDPWRILSRIRASIAPDAFVIACIPNAQHWSVQARLNCGAFRYEDKGLMDRTHIRWFCRATIDELFQSCGYAIVDGRSRIVEEAHREVALVGVRAFAKAIGADIELAATNATPLQYIVRAVPV